jgi:preprotein translocase subunit SecE
VSDEGNVADDAASDGGEAQDGGGGRTAVVTKATTRPQRPTGKRSRARVADAAGDPGTQDGADGTKSSTEGEVSAEGSDSKQGSKKGSGSAKKGAKTAEKSGKSKKPKKSGDRSANPFVFLYTYLKQVVAEMRKVIWPNRKQMLTYTSVVLAFLAFMVTLVGLADLGLTKLVMLVFG